MHLYVYCLIHKTARHCLAARLVLFIEWFSLICLFIPCWYALNYIFFTCLLNFMFDFIFAALISRVSHRDAGILRSHIILFIFFLHNLFNCFIDSCSIYLVIQSIPVEIYIFFCIYLFIHSSINKCICNVTFKIIDAHFSNKFAIITVNLNFFQCFFNFFFNFF